MCGVCTCMWWHVHVVCVSVCYVCVMQEADQAAILWQVLMHGLPEVPSRGK